MTALAGGSFSVRFIGDSAKQTSSTPFFQFRRSLAPSLSRALKTTSDGIDLLSKPAVAAVICQTVDRSDEVVVDWEDDILAETVPLVGLVRTILHSGRYKCGDRLVAAHEKAITERLLPYHPDYKNKIEGGINYLMVDYHPEFPDTRCMFIVKDNGESIDFSYWKCVKGLIRKKYPLLAENFIHRHFQSRRRIPMS